MPARLALGATMLYHGTGKLGGDGAGQAAESFESIGIRPGRFWALATGIAESFAGVAAILGIATRPAALAVIATQAAAIAKVHAPKGFDTMKGGMEFNLTLIAVALGLLLAGPGGLSTHQAARRLVDGGGARRLWRRARPTPLSRAVALLK